MFFSKFYWQQISLLFQNHFYKPRKPIVFWDLSLFLKLSKWYRKIRESLPRIIDNYNMFHWIFVNIFSILRKCSAIFFTLNKRTISISLIIIVIKHFYFIYVFFVIHIFLCLTLLILHTSKTKHISTTRLFVHHCT